MPKNGSFLLWADIVICNLESVRSLDLSWCDCNI